MKIILILLFASCSFLASEELRVRSIVLSRMNMGWTITVNPDGSGSVYYGSAATDVALFEKGIIDFKKLHQDIKKYPKMKKRSNSDPIVQIGLRINQEGAKMEGRKALKCWVELCHKIEPKLKPLHPGRFQKLIKKRPLLKEGEKDLYLKKKAVDNKK